jgi:hypothetical protein
MRKFLSLPYCEPFSFHQSGVKTPRLSPKSPGDVHVPTSVPLTVQRDVGRPVGTGAGHFRAQLHDEFDLANAGIRQTRIVRKLVFDMAAGEPDQRRFHAVRIEKRVGNIEQADDAVDRTEPARRRHLEARIEPERHRHLDGIRFGFLDLVLEDHEDLVIDAVADLLVALAGLLRLGADQPCLFQHLHVRRDARLRQGKDLSDFVDVERPLLMQQLQHGDPCRRCQPLETGMPSSGSTTRKLRLMGFRSAGWKCLILFYIEYLDLFNCSRIEAGKQSRLLVNDAARMPSLCRCAQRHAVYSNKSMFRP